MVTSPMMSLQMTMRHLRQCYPLRHPGITCLLPPNGKEIEVPSQLTLTRGLWKGMMRVNAPVPDINLLCNLQVAEALQCSSVCSTPLIKIFLLIPTGFPYADSELIDRIRSNLKTHDYPSSSEVIRDIFQLMARGIRKQVLHRNAITTNGGKGFKGAPNPL